MPYMCSVVQWQKQKANVKKQVHHNTKNLPKISGFEVVFPLEITWLVNFALYTIISRRIDLFAVKSAFSTSHCNRFSQGKTD